MPRDPKFVAQARYLREHKREADVKVALQKARDAKWSAVCAAVDAGVSKAQIARDLVTSEVRVRQMVNKTRARAQV